MLGKWSDLALWVEGSGSAEHGSGLQVPHNALDGRDGFIAGLGTNSTSLDGCYHIGHLGEGGGEGEGRGGGGREGGREGGRKRGREGGKEGGGREGGREGGNVRHMNTFSIHSLS